MGQFVFDLSSLTTYVVMGNDHHTLAMTYSLYTHCHVGWICVLQTQFQLKLWNHVLKNKISPYYNLNWNLVFKIKFQR